MRRTSLTSPPGKTTLSNNRKIRDRRVEDCGRWRAANFEGGARRGKVLLLVRHARNRLVSASASSPAVSESAIAFAGTQIWVFCVAYTLLENNRAYSTSSPSYLQKTFYVIYNPFPLSPSLPLSVPSSAHSAGEGETTHHLPRHPPVTPQLLLYSPLELFSEESCLSNSH